MKWQRYVMDEKEVLSGGSIRSISISIRSIRSGRRSDYQYKYENRKKKTQFLIFES